MTARIRANAISKVIENRRQFLQLAEFCRSQGCLELREAALDRMNQCTKLIERLQGAHD